MKAAVFHSLGRPLEISDVPDPAPAEGEVILRVARCGICGTDVHMTEPGGPGMPDGVILGHEIAGEVVALGKGVKSLNIGDRVAALPIKGCGDCAACRAGESKWCRNLEYIGGGFAEYARAGANEALVLPRALSLADGALVEPLAVSLHGVRMVDIRSAHVLVIGAGPIGLGVVFWARRFGAACIDVREGNPARQKMALELGADNVEPPAPTPSFEQLIVGDFAAPEIVFECVGRAGLLQNAVSQVRPRGTVVSLGVCMVAEPFIALAAMRREVVMKFPAIYTLQDYRDAIAALDASSIGPRVMLTTTVSLAELPDQLESLRRPSSMCKVLVDPWKRHEIRANPDHHASQPAAAK